MVNKIYKCFDDWLEDSSNQLEGPTYNDAKLAWDARQLEIDVLMAWNKELEGKLINMTLKESVPLGGFCYKKKWMD